MGCGASTNSRPHANEAAPGKLIDGDFQPVAAGAPPSPATAAKVPKESRHRSSIAGKRGSILGELPIMRRKAPGGENSFKGAGLLTRRDDEAMTGLSPSLSPTAAPTCTDTSAATARQ